MTRRLLFVTLSVAFLFSVVDSPLASPEPNEQVTASDTALKPRTAEAQPDASKPPGEFATIEGTVSYQPDPKRPWKLSRYYIASPKSGRLAETVVALEGPNLAQDAPQKPAQTRNMDQVNFQFVPETVALRAGDSLKVMNSDDALHNVMTSDGQKPFNVTLAKGREFTRSFDQAGGLAHPIRLGCLFHNGMRAWIYVFDHPWFTVTKGDGRFRFEGVPPGNYTLSLVHSAGKLHWSRPLVLKRKETSSLDIQLTPDNVAGSK